MRYSWISITIFSLLNLAFADPASAEERTEYQYDALGRLTKVVVKDGSGKEKSGGDYSYDPVGNRVVVATRSSRKKVVVLPIGGYKVIRIN